MKPSLLLPRCRRQTWASAVNAWVMTSFATGVAQPGAVARHLRRCPACRRRAAGAWSFLREADAPALIPIPEPDLSFLLPARPLP